MNFSQLAQEAEGEFGVDSYSSQFVASSPANIKQLVELLIKEERVWKIYSFTYHRSDENTYIGNIEFELHYQMDN